MIAENPSPDIDTMETLIETNDQLSKALSQHQRAVLNARKATGVGSSTPTPPVTQNAPYAPPPRTESGFAAPPPGPPPGRVEESRFTRKQPPIPPPGDYAPVDPEDDNPFSDPTERTSRTKTPPLASGKGASDSGPNFERLGVEPYHPGFKETRSYVGRQDSAVDHTTMHAAVAGPDLGRPAGSERTTEDRRDERRREDSEGEQDRGTKAPTKGPVYRY